MSNNKQSSVEWLMQQISLKYGAFQAIAFYEENFKEFQEAKAMHKEEIIKAISFGVVKGLNVETYTDCDWVNRYYKETFESNEQQEE